MGVNGCNIGCMLRSESLQIVPEILSLIAQIDEFKGASLCVNLPVDTPSAR